jgi:hypothetical protein
VSTEIGVGVALTYVGIPITLLGGTTLAVGYLADSPPVQVTGWIVTGAGVVVFAVGLGFLISGSEQGPQPQAAVATPRPALPDPRRAERLGRSTTFVLPVVAGSF